MACSGAHCTNHSTGTATCSSHRSGCATNRPLTYGAPAQGSEVRAVHVEDLRSKIRAEVERYNLNPNYNIALREPAAISTGNEITENSLFYNLDLMIHGMIGGAANVGTGWSAQGTEVRMGSFYQTLINEYNSARQNCICNADCSCNNVCSCHNDCGCNYSDMRLKKEIQYC